MYYGMKLILVSSFSINDLFEANLKGVIFISIFVFFEFNLNYFFSFDIQNLISRSSLAFSEYNIFDVVFYRSYGFSEEPTYLAWYYNTLGLLALFTLWKNRSKLVATLISFLIFVAYLSTFSAAAFSLLILSLLIYMLFSLKLKLILKTLFFFLTIYFVVSFVVGFENFYKALEPMIMKVLLTKQDSGNRFPEWVSAIDLFFTRPILGNGLGYFASMSITSPMNFFLFILVESGILVLIFSLVFYFIKFYKLLKSKIDNKMIYIISFMCGFGHLFTQSLFYHPCLWILIILIDYEIKIYKLKNI